MAEIEVCEPGKKKVLTTFDDRDCERIEEIRREKKGCRVEIAASIYVKDLRSRGDKLQWHR